MNDNDKKKEEEIIEFSHNGEKYKAKNTKNEQDLPAEGKADKNIKITNLEKSFFWTKASIDGKDSQRIKFNWPFWGGISLLIVLALGGLAWFLISRKNRQQAAQEENAL